MDKSKRSLYISLISILLILLLIAGYILKDNAKLISVNEFKQLILNQKPQEIILDDSYVTIEINGDKYRVARDSVSFQDISGDIPIEHKGEISFIGILGKIGIVVMALLGLAVLFRAFKLTFGANVNKETHPIAKSSQNPAQSSINKLPKSYLEPIKSDVTFEQVAGIKEVKEDLLEIIDYLKHPKKYKDLGLYLPRGVLLVGPPGVGKTLIAKAVAGISNVPFFYQSGSSFAEIYVGMGAKKVSDLFSAARASAPSVIFIDEIDALGKARGGNRNDEREATLNQLLTEMDGFVDNSGVMVIAATNKIEVLDTALLRSGRFDRRIHVSLPDVFEREAILELHLKGKAHNLDLKNIAKMCVGFSGAALASLVNESGLHAIKRHSDKIEQEDILATKDKVLSGSKKAVLLSDKEKEILSLYQGAKALISSWAGLEYTSFSLMGDNIKPLDKALISKSEMINIIKVALSGVIAVQNKYNEIYSNAKEDISIAKNIASNICQNYDLSDTTFSQEDEYEIIEDTTKHLQDILVIYKTSLDEIASKLYMDEVIHKESVEQILKKNNV